MENQYKLIMMLLLPIILFAQTENWVYTYNGPGNSTDKANSIVYGRDGNIYAAGCSYGVETSLDFTVISLTSTGDTNWIYRYNGPGDGWDEANSIIYGTDGNLYIAGKINISIIAESTLVFVDDDFTVISLDTLGAERWIYTYDGEEEWDRDKAYSIVYGADGNIYVAGLCYGSGTYSDFTVISLSTEGDSNWVYKYDGPANDEDEANSVIYGEDGNIYAAGYCRVQIFPPDYDFTVISLMATGDTNWIYRGDSGKATSIVYGEDNHIYASGSSCIGIGADFTVVSLEIGGDTNWVYRYNGAGNSLDRANSIVYGSDGNIYAAGISDGGKSHTDFTVISLTTSGDTNWIYTYDGHQTDIANSVVYGQDGNIYVAGTSDDFGFSLDFIVINLETSGNTSWTYTYNEPGNHFDLANSIVYGDDGNVYAAGYSTGSGTGSDFTVISLGAVGIEENHISNPNPSFVNLEVFPNPFSEKTEITYCVRRSAKNEGRNAYGVGRMALDVYDVAGRLVKQFNHLTIQPFNQITWDGTENSDKKLPSGVYFLKLDIDSETETFSDTKKLLLLK